MHGPTEQIRADKGLGLYKFCSSLVLFSLVALFLVAAVLRLDLSTLVLCLMATGTTFMSLRAVNMLRLSWRIKGMVKRYGREFDAAAAAPLAWRHAIVIPIYKESIDTIGRTIGNLARQQAAKTNYVILCAHEKSDPEHEEKFRRMHEQYAAEFLGFEKSVHVIVPSECPGKAPNVNCAVRKFAASQPRETYANTMITVIDCDTLIDERYFRELERLVATVADPHAVVLAAPAFFESNRLQVPCFVRGMDDLWSMGAAANIFSNSRLGFPISNYSMSLKMADDLDYWDVDYDSVGEDFHMFVKASVTLNKDVRMVPVAVPMNNENVEGHTYQKSLVARYAQSMRHALGIASTAYLLRHVLSAPKSLRKWVLLLLCYEAHTLPQLYLASGLYVSASIWLGDFGKYFHDGKFTLFLTLGAIAGIAGNIVFTTYKLTQFYVRHVVFRQPRNLPVEIHADACDLCVQTVCGFGYFVIPFGYRMLQNLAFRTNKVYYNKFEESSRKHR